MARGYPDRFGQPQFPKYGAIRWMAESKLCSEQTLTPLFSIDGAGLIHSAMLYSTDNNFNTSSYFRMAMDEVSIFTMNIAQLLKEGIFNSDVYPFFIVCYDEIYPRYTIGFKPNANFSEKVEIGFVNASPNPVYVTYVIFYSYLTL